MAQDSSLVVATAAEGYKRRINPSLLAGVRECWVVVARLWVGAAYGISLGEGGERYECRGDESTGCDWIGRR